MKTKLSLLAAFVLFAPSVVFAIGAPVLDELPDAVDAPTLLIKGKAEPNAKITAIGGPNEIPPVTSTADGSFKIRVGLTQEETNIFSITATKNGEVSESIVVIIKEGKEEALEYQRVFGRDVIAPESVQVDPYTSPVNSDVIIITGTAEPNSQVDVFRPNSEEIGSVTASADGTFEVCVPLEQEIDNFINFTSQDAAGNVSIIEQKKVIETNTGTIVRIDTRRCEKAESINVDIAPPFTDLQGHWAAVYIEKLRAKGIVGGKKAGIFAPNDIISRAELIKIAMLAFDIEAIAPQEKPFEDVELNVWYTPFIHQAKQLNLISGYANNNFLPNAAITRAEALKTILAASGLNLDYQKAYYFPDVDVNAWYSKYIAFALDNNIMGGYEDGLFRPHEKITRAEVSKVVALALDEIKKQAAEKPQQIEDDEVDNEEETTNDIDPEEDPIRSESDDEDEFADEDELIDVDGEKESDTNGEFTFNDEVQIYENTFFKFQFSFDKNWFFNWPGASGDDVATIYLSEKDPSSELFEETDNLVIVHLKRESIEDIEIEDDAEVTIDGTFQVYKAFDNGRHIVIEADEKYKDEVLRVAATLEIEEE